MFRVRVGVTCGESERLAAGAFGSSRAVVGAGPWSTNVLEDGKGSGGGGGGGGKKKAAFAAAYTSCVPGGGGWGGWKGFAHVEPEG